MELENECRRLQHSLEAAQIRNFIDEQRPAARSTEIDDNPKSSLQPDISLQSENSSKKKSKQKQVPAEEPKKSKGIPESSVNLKAVKELFSGV
ncbi:hypothetical protein CVT26_010769 [Gymnopilus dilepis]|uniref:Uncharacterized protein n=1 Tax=Gymnopilus dilepis TaxID=231916 RepID=A0A409W593_9AGAR|nr:hypothetical protein CVT26_010769 [Gymnopilus dilepis]